MFLFHQNFDHFWLADSVNHHLQFAEAQTKGEFLQPATFDVFYIDMIGYMTPI